jgi:hypothetical protein
MILMIDTEMIRYNKQATVVFYWRLGYFIIYVLKEDVSQLRIVCLNKMNANNTIEKGQQL